MHSCVASPGSQSPRLLSETTTLAAQPLIWVLAAVPLVVMLLAWMIWRRQKALEESQLGGAHGRIVASIV